MKKMAKTSKLTTYLAGPMEGVSANNAIEWRDRILPKLMEYFGDNIDIVDPCKTEGSKLEGLIDEGTDLKDSKKIMKGWKDTGKWNCFDKAMKKIRQEDLHAVYNSDFIIFYLDSNVIMGGTVSELEHAYDWGIPIYAVINEVSKLNSWVLGTVRQGGTYYPNFSQLLDAVCEDFKEFKKK